MVFLKSQSHVRRKSDPATLVGEQVLTHIPGTPVYFTDGIPNLITDAYQGPKW
ncbi:hypothetical protein COCC4DRAFT_32039 [Bipolaris maydis ATCC 48331]|uniref:Uncharacterized protein n=2 Tax=Cochliobolus heterostrophus TaxID=5016 RepID=M2STM4_COCH5|nr:uncharacterized protein COCC4DRAFT_32039 [Bipolaris maydis ATCC 48331]EMD88720.1 hypothetical protein COCHEDRAFT_1022988 [Bipolaris maydis C5]ENI05565.1 hypothetical protein COCC4DRAFT_32039 [Bipolaris maydis ATCC 48331]